MTDYSDRSVWSDRQLIHKMLETYYPCPSNRCLCSLHEPELHKIMSALLTRMQPQAGWVDADSKSTILQGDLICYKNGERKLLDMQSDSCLSVEEFINEGYSYKPILRVLRPVASEKSQETETPKGYKSARGAIPWKPGDEPAEDVIRRARGGEKSAMIAEKQLGIALRRFNRILYDYENCPAGGDVVDLIVGNVKSAIAEISALEPKSPPSAAQDALEVAGKALHNIVNGRVFGQSDYINADNMATYARDAIDEIDRLLAKEVSDEKRNPV